MTVFFFFFKRSKGQVGNVILRRQERNGGKLGTVERERAGGFERGKETLKHEQTRKQKRGGREEKEKESKNWGCFPFLFVIRMQACGGNASTSVSEDTMTQSHPQNKPASALQPAPAVLHGSQKFILRQNRADMANARHQISITKRVCPKFCGFPPNQQQPGS